MSKSKPTFLILSLLLTNLIFPLCSFSQAPSEETLTVTTYYPAPYGVYNEMRAKRMAVGKDYYAGSYVCWQPDTCVNIIPTGAFDPDVDLVVQGNVGIGTTSPAAGLKVDIQGKVGGKLDGATDGELKVNCAGGNGCYAIYAP